MDETRHRGVDDEFSEPSREPLLSWFRNVRSDKDALERSCNQWLAYAVAARSLAGLREYGVSIEEGRAEWGRSPLGGVGNKANFRELTRSLVAWFDCETAIDPSPLTTTEHYIDCLTPGNTHYRSDEDFRDEMSVALVKARQILYRALDIAAIRNGVEPLDHRSVTLYQVAQVVLRAEQTLRNNLSNGTYKPLLGCIKIGGGAPDQYLVREVVPWAWETFPDTKLPDDYDTASKMFVDAKLKPTGDAKRKPSVDLG